MLATQKGLYNTVKLQYSIGNEALAYTVGVKKLIFCNYNYVLVM